MARKRRAARRRPVRRKTVRRRRRRNPSHKLDVKALGVGALAGAALAGADFALAGQSTIPLKHQGLVELGIGLLVGGIASMYQKELGVGLAAAGVAVGGANLLRTYVKSTAATKTTAETSGYPMMGAVRAPQLGAVTAPLGQNAWAEMGAVQAFVDA